jgi:hypothetical protein
LYFVHTVTRKLSVSLCVSCAASSGSINATPIIIDRPKCTLGLFRIKNVVLILYSAILTTTTVVLKKSFNKNTVSCGFDTECRQVLSPLYGRAVWLWVLCDFFPVAYIFFSSLALVIPVILDRMNTSSTDTLFILTNASSIVNLLTRCTWFALFYLWTTPATKIVWYNICTTLVVVFWSSTCCTYWKVCSRLTWTYRFTYLLRRSNVWLSSVKLAHNLTNYYLWRQIHPGS